MISLIGCCAIASGCSSRVVRELDLGGVEIPAGFLVRVGSDGRAVDVSDSFGIRDGQIIFGVLPHLELEESDDPVVLLVLEQTQLAEAARAYAPANISALSATLEAAPGSPQFLEDGLRLRVAFPGDTAASLVDFRDSGMLRTFEGDRGELFAGLSLIVPIDPESCRIPDLPPLTPFTASPVEVPSEKDRNEYRNYISIRLLDRVRAVTRSEFSIRLLHKGGDGEFQAEKFVDRVMVQEGVDLRFRGIAVDRVDGRVLVAAWDHVINAITPFAVALQVTVGVDRIEDVQKLFTVDSEAFFGVAIDEDGTAAFLGQTGRVHLYARDGARSELPRIIDDAFDPKKIISTGDRDRPWLIGTKGKVHLYDARIAAWDSYSIPLTTFDEALGQPGLDPIDVKALAAARTANGQLELWAGGSAGAVLKRVEDGAWEIIDMVMPPRYRPCAYRGEYPLIAFGAHIDELVVDGDHVIGTMRECNAVFEMRRDNYCVAVLTDAIDPVTRRFNYDLQAADMIDGTLVIAGERSQVLKSER